MIKELSKVFDVVRLLDEETLETGNITDVTDAKGFPCKCYSFWKKRNNCKNCTSRDAFRKKNEQLKLEYLDSNIYQVISKYVEIDGKPYVMELINVMNSDAVMDEDGRNELIKQLSGYNRELYTDALTGIYNRRYYEERIRNSNMSAGVAMIDLDDFKMYNDTYGHQAGDAALRTAVEVVRGCIRKSDHLIRYGGDEFLLVLPGIAQAAFVAKLERIRQQLHTAVVPGYTRLQISTSIGGVMSRPGESCEQAASRADRLMYQAKNHKNTVVTEDTAGTAAPSAAGRDRQARQNILIVDDSEMNRAILAEILGSDYNILEASNGQECLTMLDQYDTAIALILLDIVMPVMDGFEVLNTMNRNHRIEDIPVIMISSEDADTVVRRAYELGVSDYVSRPFDAGVVYRRVFNTIKLYAKQRRLISLVTSQIREKEKNTQMLISILSEAVEFRNGESGAHVLHIGTLTRHLLEQLTQKTDQYALTPEQQELIVMASSLHDIGKIAIDDAILNKPGRLTREEFDIMKRHTTIGAAMLDQLHRYRNEPLVRTAHEICRWHHERWDGRGYPDGLSGDQIPISAQVVAMADVYDALVSKRVYKDAYAPDVAVQMILHGDCGAFNPLLLECLTDLQDTFKAELAAPEA